MGKVNVTTVCSATKAQSALEFIYDGRRELIDIELPDCLQPGDEVVVARLPKGATDLMFTNVNGSEVTFSVEIE